MLAETYTDWYVGPTPLLLLFTAVVLLAVPGAIVTALKGRWGWLLVGVLLLGWTLILSAFLPAAPDSWWARRAARRAT
jgi:hypothetical protein